MRRFLFGTRRRVVVTAMLAMLALPGAAIAAFIIYNGLTGSATGSFGSASTTAALTVTQNGPVPNILGPGDTETMPLTATSNDPSNSHTVTSNVTGSFSSTPAVCATHLSLNDPGFSGPGTGFAGKTVTPLGTYNGVVTIHADATIPSSCASGSYSVTLSAPTD